MNKRMIAIPLATALCAAAYASIEPLSLDGEWRLDYWPQPEHGAIRTLAIPAHETTAATVPGNCELDLVRAGVLPDPEIGLNALTFRKYEGYQWLYTRKFSCAAVTETAELVFDGIDTLADVFLNGEKIGEAENMFIPHRFNATGKLKNGENTVQVLLRSVFIDSRDKTLGELGYTMQGGAEGEPYRKAGHMGGWDIFPRLFVSGLWRGVRLEVRRHEADIDQTSWIVKSVDRATRRAEISGSCRIRMPFQQIGMAKVSVRLAKNGKTISEQSFPARHFHQSFAMSVQDVEFWWPRGYGDPVLYNASIELTDSNNRLLAMKEERIGLRTVELVRDDVYSAERPGQFLFKVNGEPIYIRGSNWVPLDALHGRDAALLHPTLELFKDLNCNMVRVWGGGVYEPDAFFDWCDENGVLVWQDFMTGCSMFPFNPDYQRQTREEAVSVVLRLRNHPSLALWSGNNENDCATRWRLGQSKTVNWNPGDDVTSRVTLPLVIREFDVSRPYLPSSPYFSPDVVAGKAKPSEDHLWGARAYYKVGYYTNSPCWFASEMGYHGCPNRASLEKMMSKGNAYPWTEVTGNDPWKDFHWNKEWQFKASDPWMNGFGARRNSLMTNQIKIMFKEVPTDFDEFILASQTVQAEAMKTFVELFRADKFKKKNGLIWWNVRDGWPQISDAVVDYYGEKKLAYHAIRNSQFNQLVCITDDGRVSAVNDTLQPVKGKVNVSDLATRKVLVEKDYDVPANAAAVIDRVSWTGQGVLSIKYEQGGEKHSNWFLYGEPPFDFHTIATLLTEARK
ncbi:MAG: glycoside hydrolase family 2 [Kiritimatiellae bacterium]|nr:glycoside hydrolase family 2 [Kiritimatiellia bacterium]